MIWVTSETIAVSNASLAIRASRLFCTLPVSLTSFLLSMD